MRKTILEVPVIKNATDVKARLALAGFLQGRQDMREAIPHLASIARSDTADTALRIRACSTRHAHTSGSPGPKRAA